MSKNLIEKYLDNKQEIEITGTFFSDDGGKSFVVSDIQQTSLKSSEIETGFIRKAAFILTEQR